MPELPEVETMRRGILPIVGARIAAVDFPRCKLKPIGLSPDRPAFKKQLAGRKIEGIGRIGKRVVVHLERDGRLIFEPRMTGLVLLADPPNVEHLRLRLTLDSPACPQLLYWDRRGLGSVRLYSAAELAAKLGPEKLGPDALEISPDEFRTRLAAGRRAIKVALLDQRAVAGIGNLYASEMCHLARIHPAATCDRLTAKQWKLLHAAMREILETAIRYEGSTLSDGTYRNALNKAGGYQNAHRVYDRAGEVCPSCGRGEVVRIVQAQRSTFFCPKCQASGKSLSK